MKSEIPISMFEREVLIRFSHCDPGGIVFYPQYFVLMNGLVEDWFTEGLNINFADFVRYRRVGIPTVRMNCTFSRPSYIGDRLTLGLSVTKVGNSSFHLEVMTCPLPAVPSKRREVRQIMENDGHEEEQIQRRADHWFSQAGRCRGADQGPVPQGGLL